MSRQISVPDDAYDKVARIAGECRVPVEDFIATALADQIISTASQVRPRANQELATST